MWAVKQANTFRAAPPTRPRMEDFKWCVWLSPPDAHAWHGFIDGVPAHLSVAVYLETEAEARRMAERLVQAPTLPLIGWNGPLLQTCTNGFYALTRDVEVLATGCAVAHWWPDDAHISFGYKYGAPFTDNEVAGVLQRLAHRHHEAELSVCRIAKATGHYRDWISEKIERPPRGT